VIFMASSWVLTLAVIAFWLRAHRRLVLVARATHELRGPLFAVQLGLPGLGGEPARLAAIELELARARRALEDLTAAPSGGPTHTSRELVDLTELVESYAPAWRTLAAGYGAVLRVEPPLTATRLEPEERATGGFAWSRRRAPARAAAASQSRPPGVADPRPPAPTKPLRDARPPGVADPRPPAPTKQLQAQRPPGVSDRRPPGVADPGPPGGTVPLGDPRPPGVSDPPRSSGVLPPAHWRCPQAQRAVTTVFADPLRIAQACANLVGNAAEHGGGVVRVRVRATSERVRIEVSDDGPGLPMSVSALTATARTRRGRRGHGLAIAAAIAEHHGGRLHAGPSDQGARLMLDMPAAHEPVVA